METPDEEQWILDPDMIVFSGGDDLPVGSVEQHGFGDRLYGLFRRTVPEVTAEWAKVVEQMKHLISQVEGMHGDFELSEVQFQLGFSAQGAIVFIAEAGVNATISATFTRRATAASPTDS